MNNSQGASTHRVAFQDLQGIFSKYKGDLSKNLQGTLPEIYSLLQGTSSTFTRDLFKNLLPLHDFPGEFKNNMFPKYWGHYCNLLIGVKVLPKSKMVRMVHWNLFDDTEFEICDPTTELWRKTEHLEGWMKLKIPFRGSKGIFKGCSKIEMIFRNLGFLQSFRFNFHILY